jgi:hypothetical protein
MLAMPIVMLNLLIAIMGDAYQIIQVGGMPVDDPLIPGNMEWLLH